MLVHHLFTLSASEIIEHTTLNKILYTKMLAVHSSSTYTSCAVIVAVSFHLVVNK